eukprot:6251947-Lingulodinium_polyedra.AAC.1
MLALQRGLAASRRLTLAVACGQTSTPVPAGSYLLVTQMKNCFGVGKHGRVGRGRPTSKTGVKTLYALNPQP